MVVGGWPAVEAKLEADHAGRWIPQGDVVRVRCVLPVRLGVDRVVGLYMVRFDGVGGE